MKNKVPASRVDEAVYNLHEYSLDIDSRSIYLHGHYYTGADDSDVGVDYRMANTFIKNITFLGRQSTEPVTIHMTSVGGSWGYGMAIYDAIRASKSYVTIIAYAHARSMTSVILQAADFRVLMPTCSVVIHHGWVGADDRCEAVLSQMEQCKKEMEAMLCVYADRCYEGEYFKGKSYSHGKIKAFIDRKLKNKQDWIMNAEEAVYYGFADKIQD